MQKDLLRCVDPDDVQVAEVHALLVQERVAGAALRAHMSPPPGHAAGLCGFLPDRRGQNCGRNQSMISHWYRTTAELLAAGPTREEGAELECSRILMGHYAQRLWILV